jgi:hypothetical protein
VFLPFLKFMIAHLATPQSVLLVCSLVESGSHTTGDIPVAVWQGMLNAEPRCAYWIVASWL